MTVGDLREFMREMPDDLPIKVGGWDGWDEYYRYEDLTSEDFLLRPGNFLGLTFD